MPSLPETYIHLNTSLDNHCSTLDSQDIASQDQTNSTQSSVDLPELLMEELPTLSPTAVSLTNTALGARSRPYSVIEEDHLPQLNEDRNATGSVVFLDGDLKSPKLTMEERLGRVLTACRTAGFRNFDTAVASYYTARLQSGSTIDQAQRISRRCYLPGVLMALGTALQDWPTTESQGFVDQVLDITQAILVEECRTEAAREVMQEIRPDLMVDSDADDVDSTVHVLHMSHIKREFQRAVSFWPVKLSCMLIIHLLVSKVIDNHHRANGERGWQQPQR